LHSKIPKSQVDPQIPKILGKIPKQWECWTSSFDTFPQ